MDQHCPLCLSNEVIVIERIPIPVLSALYKKMLGVSIVEEFSDCKELSFYLCDVCDLRFFHPALTGSEKFYERLQRFEWYYMEDKEEYEFAKQYISESDLVLEVGCGSGAFAKKIKAREYTGLEFSAKAKEMGERTGLCIVNETVQDHATKKSQGYDVVCSFQVLEHVSDIKGFLKSSVECLRAGGLLFVSVPSADSFLSIVENGILNMPPHHVSWWSDKALAKIADIFGLEIVKIEHEKLADIHLRWYTKEVVRKALKDMVGVRYKMISTTLSDRIIGLLADAIGNLYAKGLSDPFLRPNGHSVTIIYRKPGIVL